jgi:hypothetical protein
MNYLKEAISEAILGDENKYREENWNLSLLVSDNQSNSRHYLAVGIDGRINYSSSQANNMLLEYR